MASKSTVARRDFTQALQQLVAAGTTVPCIRWHDEPPWTSDNPLHRQAAAVLCKRCPLRAECLTLGRAEHHTFGVWGGRDLTRRTLKEQP